MGSQRTSWGDRIGVGIIVSLLVLLVVALLLPAGAWLVGYEPSDDVTPIEQTDDDYEGLDGDGFRSGGLEDSDCDPNYEGACIDPGGGDVDCENGSGDGPQYVGEVEVVGEDWADLDRDGDGVACEPYDPYY